MHGAGTLLINKTLQNVQKSQQREQGPKTQNTLQSNSFVIQVTSPDAAVFYCLQRDPVCE